VGKLNDSTAQLFRIAEGLENVVNRYDDTDSSRVRIADGTLDSVAVRVDDIRIATSGILRAYPPAKQTGIESLDSSWLVRRNFEVCYDGLMHLRASSDSLNCQMRSRIEYEMIGPDEVR